MASIPIFAALAKGKDTVTVPLVDAQGAGGCGEISVMVEWVPDANDPTALTATQSFDPQLSETAIEHLHEEATTFHEQLAVERERRMSGLSTLSEPSRVGVVPQGPQLA